MIEANVEQKITQDLRSCENCGRAPFGSPTCRIGNFCSLKGKEAWIPKAGTDINLIKKL